LRLEDGPVNRIFLAIATQNPGDALNVEQWLPGGADGKIDHRQHIQCLGIGRRQLLPLGEQAPFPRLIGGPGVMGN
jgi:hypothetical protein